MKIRATVTEHSRIAGKDYSVPFYIGARLIARRHAKFISTESGEPDWRPSEPLCVQDKDLKAPPDDKMMRGPQVRKGAA